MIKVKNGRDIKIYGEMMIDLFYAGAAWKWQGSEL
jgi:hypothetical protein